MSTPTNIIIYLIMVAFGFSLLALMWVAMVDRGMVKCRLLKQAVDKQNLSNSRKAQKQFQQQAEYTAKKKPQRKQQFQNPKKKKKK